jgi:hypothetical protein
VSDYSKITARAANRVLEPDEALLAACPCLPKGAITARALGANPSHELGGAALPSLLALGVTNRRLLVFSMGVTDRPKRLFGALPLASISAAGADTQRAVGMKMLRLTLVLVDGSAIELDVPREHLRAGLAVHEALVRAVPGGADLPRPRPRLQPRPRPRLNA